MSYTYRNIQSMSKGMVCLLAGIAFFLSAVSVEAQTRRALVIGLGEQQDAAWGKINGDKDVPYVVEMLQDARYKQIRTCVNRQATKQGIISELKHLSATCEPGDIVYIHYSGHGQQVRDLNNDEKDRLDESWIPYDAYRKPCQQDRGEKHLTDDEINSYLMELRRKIGKEGKMLVVIDACHSGDATRSSETEVVRGVEDVFEAFLSLFSSSDKEKAAPRHVRIRQKSERWITLSACESSQVNIEMQKPAVGKLTYALYTRVKQKDWTDNMGFFVKLRKFINRNTGSRPQRPVMTGETTKYNIQDIIG